MFTSVRKQTKYKYFVICKENGDVIQSNIDILESHEILRDGVLLLIFENSEYQVHKEWSSIDYGYNKPQ